MLTMINYSCLPSQDAETFFVQLDTELLKSRWKFDTHVLLCVPAVLSLNTGSRPAALIGEERAGGQDIG